MVKDNSVSLSMTISLRKIQEQNDSKEFQRATNEGIQENLDSRAIVTIKRVKIEEIMTLIGIEDSIGIEMGLKTEGIGEITVKIGKSEKDKDNPSEGTTTITITTRSETLRCTLRLELTGIWLATAPTILS